MTAPETTTQAQHPWRAVLRTIVAYIPPVAVMLPEAAEAAGVERVAWVAGILAVAGGITRVLAVPSVNRFFQQVFPPLAAAPKVDTSGRLIDDGRTPDPRAPGDDPAGAGRGR